MRKDASRSCADYARVLYMRPGAGEARVARVTIAVGAVFSVLSIQATMAPLPRPTSASIVKERVVRDQYLSRAYVSECVRLCDAHIPACGRPISVVCNDIPHDIPARDPPRTYVRTHVLTYFVRIDPRFRASR